MGADGLGGGTVKRALIKDALFVTVQGLLSCETIHRFALRRDQERDQEATRAGQTPLIFVLNRLIKFKRVLQLTGAGRSEDANVLLLLDLAAIYSLIDLVPMLF